MQLTKHRFLLLPDGQPVEIESGEYGSRISVKLPGKSEVDLRLFSRTEGCVRFVKSDTEVDADNVSTGELTEIDVSQSVRGIEISYKGRAYVFETDSARSGAKSKKEQKPKSGSIVAPMVGLVADVLVLEGEVVEAYQPLAIVEAMKVMATLEAPFAGTIQKVYVHKGDQLAHGAPIIDVAPLTESENL